MNSINNERRPCIFWVQGPDVDSQQLWEARRISCDPRSEDESSSGEFSARSVAFWQQSIVSRVDETGVHVAYGDLDVSLPPLDVDGFQEWDKPVTDFVDYPVQLFASPPR